MIFIKSSIHSESEFIQNIDKVRESQAEVIMIHYGSRG